MSILAEIDKLKGRHFLFGLIAFLGTIGPGFLIIYRYHPELVEKYDIGKLVLFASALTLPFSFAYLLTYIAVETSNKETSVEPNDGMLFGVFASTFVLNLAVAASYFFEWSFRRVMTSVCGLTGLVLAAALLYGLVRAALGKRGS